MWKETRHARQRALVEEIFVRDIALARKAKDQDRCARLEDERRWEIRTMDEVADMLDTDRLMAQARRLRVPLPHRFEKDGAESDAWQHADLVGQWVLTSKGSAIVREEIRRELKGRREAGPQWFAWLSSLTGIIGATTGLLAIFFKK